jgi:hypothetical protein
MKPLGRADVAAWVKCGWEGLSSAIVTSGFSICGFCDPPPRVTEQPGTEADDDLSGLMEELRVHNCLDVGDVDLAHKTEISL